MPFKGTLKGPNASATWCEPNPHLKYSYDRNGTKIDGGMTLAKAELNTVQYKLEDDDVDVSYGLDGPGASASCGVGVDKVKAGVNVSAFKVKADVGFMKSEFSPNLNTGVSFGKNGVETKVGGMGATLALDEVSFHTPFGSVGARLPFGNSKW